MCRFVRTDPLLGAFNLVVSFHRAARRKLLLIVRLTLLTLGPNGWSRKVRRERPAKCAGDLSVELRGGSCQQIGHLSRRVSLNQRSESAPMVLRSYQFGTDRLHLEILSLSGAKNKSSAPLHGEDNLSLIVLFHLLFRYFPDRNSPCIW